MPEFDIKSSTLDKSLDLAKDFLQKVITPPLEELGLLMADKIKLWRFKNQVEILLKAENILKAKNIKAKKVSLKIMTPLLEESSMEEEPTLQDKWAMLMANTVSENSSISSTVYSYILSQLTKNEIEIFERLYRASVNRQESGQITLVTKQLSFIHIQTLRDSNPSFDQFVDNLIRLRLIKETASNTANVQLVLLTDLGYNFMHAVNGI